VNRVTSDRLGLAPLGTTRREEGHSPSRPLNVDAAWLFIVAPAKAGAPAGERLGVLHPLGSQPSLGRRLRARTSLESLGEAAPCVNRVTSDRLGLAPLGTTRREEGHSPSRPLNVDAAWLFIVAPAKAGAPAGERLGVLHPLGSQPSLGRRVAGADEPRKPRRGRPGASAYLTRSTCSNSSSTGVARPKMETPTLTRPRSKSSSSTRPLKLANGPSRTLTLSPIS